MKKTALFVMLCMLFVTFPFTSVAEGTLTTEKFFELGEPVFDTYVENQLIVWTDEFWEPAVVSAANRTIDFYGIKATEIKPLFTATTEGRVRWSELSNDRYPYLITIQTPLSESKNVLCYESHILEIMYNYVFEAPEFESATGSAARSVSNSSTGVDYTQWAHEYLEISSVWGKSFVGSADIKVAILDCGFEEHEDLENNLDMSYAIAVGELNNYDVSTNDSHGNKVAGIIGADYNDGGVNGICRDVTMLPIKLIEDTPYIFTATILLGIMQAVEYDADIINLSSELEYTPDSVYIMSMIENNEILLVTSAGNNYNDIEDIPSAAGKCNDNPYLIVVGAMAQPVEGEELDKVPSSNYSSEYVDLFAPGQNIMTTALDDSYSTFSETSAATPHVAAALALLMSKATHKTPLQIRQLLLDNINPGFEGYCSSGGTLSIRNAISALYTENRGAYTKGDISGDGHIDAVDYLICKRIALGTYAPSAVEASAADIDGSDTVDSIDYTLVNRYWQGTYYFPPY